MKQMDQRKVQQESSHGNKKIFLSWFQNVFSVLILNHLFFFGLESKIFFVFICMADFSVKQMDQQKVQQESSHGNKKIFLSWFQNVFFCPGSKCFFCLDS